MNAAVFSAVISGLVAGTLALLLGLPLRAALTPPARTVGRANPATTSIGRRQGWRGRHGRRRETTMLPSVIDSLDALAADVRSGSSLRGALGAATRGEGDHPRTDDAARCDTARAVLDAVDSPAGRNDMHPAIAVAAQAVTSALLLGGAQALALDSAAALLRERHAVAMERAAHSAQARLSARVMTIVPVAFTAWVLLTNAEARTAMATPLGSAALAAGVLLNVSGWLWMQRIVRVRS